MSALTVSKGRFASATPQDEARDALQPVRGRLHPRRADGARGRGRALRGHVALERRRPGGGR
eukprot:14416812-Alexandrium_andersonii.AAC.1